MNTLCGKKNKWARRVKPIVKRHQGKVEGREEDTLADKQEGKLVDTLGNLHPVAGKPVVAADSQADPDREDRHQGRGDKEQRHMGEKVVLGLESQKRRQ